VISAKKVVRYGSVIMNLGLSLRISTGRRRANVIARIRYVRRGTFLAGIKSERILSKDGLVSE